MIPTAPPTAPGAPAALVLVLVLVLGAAGCGGGDFAPPTRLDRLRVLALRARPVNPPAGTATALDTLVYTPAGSAAVQHAWSWCPVAGRATETVCPVNDDQLRAIAAAAGVPSPPPLLLGNEPSQELANVFPPALLQQLCHSGLAGTARPDCRGGFPVRVFVRVTSADAEVTATTVIRLPLDAASPGNQNPVLTGVVAGAAGQHRPLDAGGQVELPRLQDIPLEVSTTEASAEEVLTDPDPGGGQPQPRRERLTLSWFAELGELDEEQTGVLPGANAFGEALRNRWTLPGSWEPTADRTRLIVVARDDRGGVGWTTALVRLAVTP
jgi:hypothetical protein